MSSTSVASRQNMATELGGGQPRRSERGLALAESRRVASRRFFPAQQIYRYPWTLISVGGSAAGLLYAAAAHAPHSAPRIIYPSAVDGFIPFVPAAAWIYATYLLLLPALVLVAARLVEFPAAIRTAVGTALLNAAVYNIWPTRIATRTVAPDGSLLSLIQALDTPLCAIPSGHVSLPVAIACSASLLAVRSTPGAQRARWTRVSAMFAMWALALAVSTLLTSQHYAVDAAAGALFGLCCAFVFTGVTNRRVSFLPGQRIAEDELSRAA